SLKDALKGARQVYFREAAGFTRTKIYDREGLGVGNRLSGPAIIEQPDSTTVLPPGAAATVDSYLNLIITPNGR
ncbi:MAG: hydantoinase/oxoprolinase family protein, partial [Nitrospinota bacterium]|nr:hydantoinase/oxoprolinase family protein [Nitrospinota bacterium]